jgi:predicted transcriptional regulator
MNTQQEPYMTVAVAKPVAIKIDEDTKSRLKRLADARQRTPHWMMREAIAQYIEREERREKFRQDALHAWETFRATGQHVTADQADYWLAQLEQGNEIDPPACRS